MRVRQRECASNSFTYDGFQLVAARARYIRNSRKGACVWCRSFIPELQSQTHIMNKFRQPVQVQSNATPACARGVRTWLSILSAMPRLAAGPSGAASTSSLLAHIQGRNAVSRASTGSFGGRGVSTVAVLRGRCGAQVRFIFRAHSRMRSVQCSEVFAHTRSDAATGTVPV